VGVSPRRLLAGITATVLVLGLAVAISEAGTARAISAPLTKVVAPHALPSDYDSYVRAASACPGLDPLLLVAIHDVETGRDPRGETSSAGAIGLCSSCPTRGPPTASTADHDGVADATNLTDALMGATHLLLRERRD